MDRKTELVLEGGVLANIGLSSRDMGDGGPTAYIFRVGLEARHWIDPHLAIGGGVLGHLLTVSEQMTSELETGIAGTFRVSGVF